MKANSSAHSKHLLHYHLVWCVKYRRSVLLPEVGDRIKQICIEIAAEQDCIITAIETDVDAIIFR